MTALGRTLTTFEGETLDVTGKLPVESRMQCERLTIGYREMESLRHSPLMPAGMRLRGQDFHSFIAEDPPHELAASRVMGDGRLEGKCTGLTLGSSVHLDLAGAHKLAAHFVASCAQIEEAGLY